MSNPPNPDDPSYSDPYDPLDLDTEYNIEDLEDKEMEKSIAEYTALFASQMGLNSGVLIVHSFAAGAVYDTVDTSDPEKAITPILKNTTAFIKAIEVSVDVRRLEETAWVVIDDDPVVRDLCDMHIRKIYESLGLGGPTIILQQNNNLILDNIIKSITDAHLDPLKAVYAIDILTGAGHDGFNTAHKLRTLLDSMKDDSNREP